MTAKQEIAVLVNADGTIDKRPFTGEYRVVDYERGRVWSESRSATSDGENFLHTYVQIPWSCFSNRTPAEELEKQKQYRRKPT